MSKTLSRRIAAVERQNAHRPPDPAADCPDAWTVRFQAHRPEYAALVASARRLPGNDTDHVGNIAVNLCLTAGLVAWYGKDIAMRPTPTPEEAEAFGVLERLLTAVGEYVGATGDRFPRAVYGLS